MLMTRTECLSHYGSDYRIQQHIKNGSLFRVDKGLFSDTAHVPELVAITQRYPKSIVTMLSAFSYYDLTDTIPEKCDLATDRNASKITDKRVRQYFLPSDFFESGVTTGTIHGYTFRIYSQERMLIELLRYKNKLPFDLYKEILLNYRKALPHLDIQEIQELALQSPKSNMVFNALQLEVL